MCKVSMEVGSMSFSGDGRPFLEARGFWINRQPRHRLLYPTGDYSIQSAQYEGLQTPVQKSGLAHRYGD